MLKSRKKILLSSIAMLLVALVALGSATFAWYYTNATVTASTTTFSASTADGLVIRHTNSDAWGTTVTNLLQRKEDATATPKTTGLTPASITYDSSLATLRGGTATATAFNTSTMDTDTLQKVDVANGDYFVVDSFYVASSSNVNKTASFTIATSAAVSGRYLNMAVYVNGALSKVITYDNDVNVATGVGKLKNGSTTELVEADTAKYTEKLVKATATVTLDNITATPKGGDDTGCKITIIAFADGFNTNCKSDSVDTTAVSATYSFSVVNPSSGG